MCHVPNTVVFSYELSRFLQEFAHPQARFLHEKRHALPPRLRRRFQPFFGAVNRASFKAIDGAMFVGTVSAAVKALLLHGLHWACSS